VKTVRKPRPLGGGYSFRRYAGQPDSSLLELPVPVNVVVPLLQGFGVPLSPLVAVGDSVAAGQIIARDDSVISSPLHATINGKVTAIGTTSFGGRQAPAVAIDGDSSPSFQRLDGFSAAWQSLAPAQIEELLYLSGVTGLAREGIPTRFRSSVILPADVRHIIVLIPGADAFNSDPAVLLSGAGATRFLEGVRIIGRTAPAARIHIASSSADSRVLGALAGQATAADGFDFCRLSSRYPQDATEMLVMSVTGDDFPFGFSAASAGVVIIDPQAALAAFDAVVEGKPVIDRVISLAGPGFERPTHVRARIGTQLGTLTAGRLKPQPVRLILDSLLAGRTPDNHELPVDRATTQVIAAVEGKARVPFAFIRPGLHIDSWSRSFVAAYLPAGLTADTNEHGEERPCIQCGQCAEICPVRIIPSLIMRRLRAGADEALVRLCVFNCIDCNLCTFACPSKIPLARHMHDAKQQLLEVGCDNSSCVLPKFDLRGIEEYKGVKTIR